MGGQYLVTDPAPQHRLVAAAPQSVPLVLSLNASAIYLGIGLGAAWGGVALTAGVPVLYGTAASIAALAGLYLLATVSWQATGPRC